MIQDPPPKKMPLWAKVICYWIIVWCYAFRDTWRFFFQTLRRAAITIAAFGMALGAGMVFEKAGAVLAGVGIIVGVVLGVMFARTPWLLHTGGMTD